MLPKADNKVFSFSEIANAMALFEGAFDKYEIQNNNEFRELNSLFCDIAIYLENDFHIIIEENEFEKIASKYKFLTLYCTSDNYFENLNSYSPFQKIDRKYFTTVVLLSRFVYRTLSQSLLKNKTFQINSGFVFEDKVSKILEEKGFLPTGITRINQKEFDLITIKNNKVFNFQCKNNFIDISRVNFDYKTIGRFNQQLCLYYEKALTKIFVAFSSNCDENVRNIFEEISKSNDYHKFKFILWDENKRPGSIVKFILDEIKTSKYGIVYFSEKAEDGNYKDNPNVLFEAGMFHALINDDDEVSLTEEWLPIREKKSPKIPFDFAQENILIVPRFEDGSLNAHDFKIEMNDPEASLEVSNGLYYLFPTQGSGN